ncbi:Double Clp-N motif-containing P-loop nucleoside triphosphate hydrolases superfamily protein [Striga hermonthica]|uniref:Double Clp-N motif-containing P-loop nucleoside triphosphate hydrolases superfamily protein n=1 Tax=Striga hermonthica TaxID=68872 RepID=A0A9N7RSP3_STRHE|nr:Double Clp-N motif-containing P-loop nucleoside triphosphate hydrolases superfamily protein [Striga hermonthica]
MRAGGCALQQSLTPESSAVVRQAVLLARRRGHSQVTPLHVATTLLHPGAGAAGGGGLLRAACAGSHSHPLRCKALELCFNVALNRLPAGPHPSVSNALVAAFKRAQAHHRRGPPTEAQSQISPTSSAHLLPVRIPLDRLVVSILDDPSVSRVMREAGFSSTQVKNNVEKAILNNNNNNNSNDLPRKKLPTNKSRNQHDAGITAVETLLLGRKNPKSIVLVGESVSGLETSVKGLMDRVDRGLVREDLREVKFVTIPPFYTFRNLRQEEVERKVGELKGLVRGLLGKGVVLYLGDFKWISEYRVRLGLADEYYCSVEHVIMEIGRLVRGIGEDERFWLMGVATFETYMSCRNGYNSLESVWGLHPVTIPSDNLGFSLVSQSDHDQEDVENGYSDQLRPMIVNGDVTLLCCADCTEKFEEEARNLRTNSLGKGGEHPSLPFWLKDESRRLNNSHNNQSSEAVKELCKKWNTFCNSTHKTPPLLDKTLTFSYTPLSYPCFSFDHQKIDSTRIHNRLSSPDPTQISNPLGSLHMPETSNINSRNTISSNSASSSEVMEVDHARHFNEFNGENLNALCDALGKEVPWQKDVIPEIVGTILQCRSGMLKRKSLSGGHGPKQETWLLFLGPDKAQSKERISKELAKIVFGSYSSFLSFGPGSTSATSSNYVERFGRAVSENPHRVFLLENLEQVDRCSRMGIKRAIERGRIMDETGQEFGFRDAIIVLSCKGFGPTRARSSDKQETDKNGVVDEDESPCFSLDLNVSLEGEAINDDDDEGFEFDEFGIFENVDRCLVFKEP